MTTRNDIERLFRNNYRAMFMLAIRMMRDEEDARDIVHDVFATVLDSKRYDVSASYLIRAVRNRCLNCVRDLSVKQQLHGRYTLDMQSAEGDEWPDEVTIARMLEIVETLPEKCRAVVKLRFAHAKSYREISQTLGISEVMVYKHLRHALNVLRLKMKDNGQI